MSQPQHKHSANTEECSGNTPRKRAKRAVRNLASIRDEFRLSAVIEQSDALTERQRDSVRRALRELERAGVVRQRTSGSPYWESLLDHDPDTEAVESPRWQAGPLKILHCFADWGVEAEALGAYGEVVRVGLNPRDSNGSQPIQADANALPFAPDTFDLGVFHPECARFSQVTSISGNPEDHPNQIPLARELGERYCEHYVLENKPQATDAEDGLECPDGGSLLTLDGRQFGLPLRYERAFETSFPVPRRPIQQPLDQEVSPYFYADRSTEYWRALKGYSGNYTKTAVAKNAVPRAFVDFLLREYFHHVGETDGQPARSNHNDPSPK